jgi:hypothetical protein
MANGGECVGQIQRRLPDQAADAGSSGEADRIETDRDSFTPATTTVGFRRLVVESAYSFIDNRQIPETHSYPELLVRYGLAERFELRCGYNFEVGGGGSTVSSSGTGDLPEEAEIEREHSISYGLKRLLTDQDAWLPQSSIIVQGETPLGGESPATQLITTYVLGWNFFSECKWDSAIRYATASERGDRFNLWAPSTVLKLPLADRWNMHAEYFGIFSSGREAETVHQFFSPGAHYLLTDDLEIGARFGWGLNDQSANFFTNVGLGLRF